jgi:hypothetical protein
MLNALPCGRSLMKSRIRGRAATVALAVAAAGTISVLTPGTASAGVWFTSQYFDDEPACVAEKNVFQYDYGFLVQPNGDRCYSSASGYYYKHMEEF